MALTPIDITNAVQLALTPAFLLTGIAGILNVMTGRLTRIIDRARALRLDQEGTLVPEHESVDEELRTLERRRQFTSMAITASTISAFLVCVVVAMLFIEGLVGASLDMIIGLLFAVAMLSLVTGLAYFLREVHCAMKKIRINDHVKHKENNRSGC